MNKATGHPSENLKRRANLKAKKMTCRIKTNQIHKRTAQLSAVPRATLMAGVAASSLVVGAGAAMAEDVTLRALDGSSDITAKLLDFDGNRYTLETTIGQIQIDALQVECISGACPTLASAEVETEAFTVSGNGYLTQGLLPELFSDFATGTGGTAEMSGNSIQISASNGTDLGGIDLASSDPNASMRSLADGSSLLAVTDSALTADQGRVFELANRANPTEDDRQVVLALDALVIIAAPGNPVNAISGRDIARIFAGRITNWAQLGGPNAAINLYAPNADSSIAVNFAEQVMQPNSMRMAGGVTVLDGDEAVSQAVAEDPFGIGFVNYSGQSAGRTLSILGSCGIQVPPTEFTIKTEEYPFTRRLFFYRATDELPTLARDFLEYLDTQDGQSIVADNGFVDKSVALISSDEQGRRYASAMWPTDAQTSLRELGEMVQELLPAQRVSLTFRFLPGSAQLEARGLEDLQRLADLIAEGEVFANKELLLVGFTDSAGTAAANRTLSQQRAARVSEILQSIALPGSMDSTPVRSLGYGEASPLTCNDTDLGRSTNRRVEVWVRDIVAQN